MKRRASTPRSVLLILALLGCAAAMACGGGGGGGGGTLPPGISATFTATTPSPSGTAITMQPGTSSGADFSVQIRVDSINNFFGAGFRVTYNPANVSFMDFSVANSFISGTGVTTQFLATPLSAGTLAVTATRQGANEVGVDSGTQALLITLNFRATSAAGANAFAFGSAATREVVSCATAGQACTTVSDASIAWSGGTLVAN